VRVRGSSATSTGRMSPASSAPRASVRTARAPRSAACAVNSAPWRLAPGRAAKRSPGRTAPAARLTPVRARSRSRASGRRSASPSTR